MERHARRAVVGAGAWGTTLALHLAKHGPTLLLARDAEQARRLTADRENKRYLPGLRLPVEVEVTADPAALAAADELVVFAVPSAGRSTAMPCCCRWRRASSPSRCCA
jgi:glycerol-3-phosphate dehydrogenase (NAD(P)+)